MGIFSMVLSLLSGVALFLFGMSLMSRTWYSRYKRYPVFRSNDCHGYRFC